MAGLLASPAHADSRSVVDDTGQRITLAAPARRIVSLAPHVTELIYAAGGGAWLVGASDYSDFPPEANRLPRVGGYQSLDLERIVALKPDLIVGWPSGSPPAQLDKLRALGIPVFLSEPTHTAQIASNLERLGLLMDTGAVATPAANRLRARFAALERRYGARPKVRVFYQIWTRPLMTLNGKHMVSRVMTACGGENVFAAQPMLTPQITREAVLHAAPEVLLATQEGDAGGRSLTPWKAWKTLPAVARGNLFYLDGNLLNRAGPRLAEGMQQLCEALETARQKR